ncbi:MAG: carboxypeptidase-like regulatory domain-containing protein [Tannerellaceae bacterium]|nr:carboxypeptidase-like regulatory domain-containing protein [Tannerellaceae bacterium]MCD8263843.1 carboxypeptidase-like regulatory domain-containing protein [Tannerellaceae bacterium]
MIKLFKPVSLVLVAVALCSPATISTSANAVTESTAVAQQSKKVTGVVEDFMGPVAGASVVKGTTNGTITDLDGQFVLDVKEGETIVVSFIGYIAQEFPVTSQNSYKLISGRFSDTG